MSSDKYCLPIIEEDIESIKTKISANLDDFDFFEIWLDYINDLEHVDLLALSSTYPNKLLFLFRRLKLAPIKTPLEQRIQLLKKIQTLPAYYDLDINEQKEEIEEIKSIGLKQAVISYHNYEETPDSQELEKIFTRIAELQPGIVKIATYCQSDDDCLQLLELLLAKKNSHRVIILGMGEKALPIRVFGNDYGNQFTFCPLDKESQSAPGQLSRQELGKLQEIIQNARK